MAIKQLNPYLILDGSADKAIKLYEKALGATTETVSRFGDAPGTSPEHKDRIMHSVLRIGPGTIMVSDSMPGMIPGKAGAVHVVLDFDDLEDMGRRFDALSAGGKVETPLQDTFWGARFGTLVDAFGIQWMFNCNLPPK